MLIKTFKKYNPSHVVIENGYYGGNVTTLKVLCEFAGVAKECCLAVLDIEPFVMNNKIVKKHFNVKTKKKLRSARMAMYRDVKKGVAK